MATATTRMQTPPRRQQANGVSNNTSQRRNYTEEEKKQLLANLDLEVKDRIRQFESYLAHSLEAFKLRHENEVTRIPRAIRTLTIGEFADKYDGDISKALKAITKAKMVAGEEPDGIEETDRKRKWQPSNEGPGPHEAESSRSAKNARLDSPQKKDASGTRPRLIKTPGRLRKPHLSPKKSPEKATALPSPSKPHQRIPSSITFNPLLPKTPAYPPRFRNGNEAAGSPTLGRGDPGRLGKKLERQRSITVLRGPSLAPGPSAPKFEMILSLKVPTKTGSILEFDPLSTTPEDLDQLEEVSKEAIGRAKDELQELNSLMARLGKWRI